MESLQLLERSRKLLIPYGEHKAAEPRDARPGTVVNHQACCFIQCPRDSVAVEHQSSGACAVGAQGLVRDGTAKERRWLSDECDAASWRQRLPACLFQRLGSPPQEEWEKQFAG